MRFVIVITTLPLLLGACATAHFEPVAPDVVQYGPDIMSRAADEIEAGACPVLGTVMMLDYGVMRDQARALKE